MRKIICICCILGTILFPIGNTGKVFADSYDMEDLVKQISDVYPLILTKLDKVNLSASEISSFKTDVNRIYTQTQEWKNSLDGEMNKTRSSIVKYDSMFDCLHGLIQEGLEKNNKQDVLRALQYLKDDLQDREKIAREFTTKIESFKLGLLEDSRKLEKDVVALPPSMKTDQEVHGIPGFTSTVEDSLYKQLMFLIQQINSANSWLGALENISVTWNELDSILSSIVEEVNHASQLNTTFMKNRLQTIHDLWKLEVIDTLNS